MKHNLIMEAPPVIRNFLTYSETIKGKSSNTIEEYYNDLKTFFRYILYIRNKTPENVDFKEISIDCVDDALVQSITLYDLHSFLVFCKNDRDNNNTTRARKASTLRIFFKYLQNQVHIISNNPAEQLDTPKIKQSLPKHLTLNESVRLLENIDGNNKERDFCIITLFLNCGMRLSELCSLDITDLREDNSLKITGKGNKERIVYLNDACIESIKAYLPYRNTDGVAAADKNALFISRNKRRLSNKTVQHIVYKRLEEAGLGDIGLSVHKLRHTAATLMYQHGNVDIRVLKDLLGHKNLGTTQIYTHVSDEQVRSAVNVNPLAKNKPKTSENKE